MLPASAPQPPPVHVLAKPIGPLCNLACDYCYYLDKRVLFPGERLRMSDAVLESFIRQNIAQYPGPVVPFAWQGGEPTLLGLDYFRRIVALQREHLPPGWQCANALQTNATRLDAEWCAFLRDEGFLVGVSLDGPPRLHDAQRRDRLGRPSHARAEAGLRLLLAHGVETNVLCVVSRANEGHAVQVYRHFRELGLRHLQFIPLVERAPEGGVTHLSVTPRGWGRFLSAVFNEWWRHDRGRVFVQLFEEWFRVWVGMEATLCLFRPRCGEALALEHNGDLFACDHYVDPAHRLGNLSEGLRELAASPAQRAFGAEKQHLPPRCQACGTRPWCHGECPKNRIAPDAPGEPPRNYLCEGYRSFFAHSAPRLRQLALTFRRQAGAPSWGL